MEDPHDTLLSIDPGIDAVVQGAGRGDRTVLPALRAYLEEALALFIDPGAVMARVAAANDGKSKAELYAVVKRTMAPQTYYERLVEAASHLPDASLEPVLQELAQRMEDDEVLDVLEKIRPLRAPAGADANMPAAGIRSRGDADSHGELARLMRDGKQRGIKAAIRRASIGELLTALTDFAARGTEFTSDIANALHRYTEDEILLSVSPWLNDADPRRREAAAHALGREGDDDETPDARTIACLHALLADPEPEIVVAALRGLGNRTCRNFSPLDLERMRVTCEQHPSVRVRATYADVFYSPEIGGNPGNGAFEVWCRMSRDEDAHQRYLAAGRLSMFLYRAEGNTEKVRAVWHLAKTDSSANVRFVALGSLTALGEDHDNQIEAELNRLAASLEHTKFTKRTGEEDDGLNLVGDMVINPRQRFVPALRRIAKAIPRAEREHWNAILERCRDAPPDG